MLNRMESQAEMLQWLSQRNHHMSLEDLAFMVGVQTSEKDPYAYDPLDSLGFDEDFSEY